MASNRTVRPDMALICMILKLMAKLEIKVLIAQEI